jgi:hypothetical protein
MAPLQYCSHITSIDKIPNILEKTLNSLRRKGNFVHPCNQNKISPNFRWYGDIGDK